MVKGENFNYTLVDELPDAVYWLELANDVYLVNIKFKEIALISIRKHRA